MKYLYINKYINIIKKVTYTSIVAILVCAKCIKSKVNIMHVIAAKILLLNNLFAKIYITGIISTPNNVPINLQPKGTIPNNLTPMAIIDLISILPSITVLNSGFRLLKLFRLLRTLKVLRTFKFLRYSKSFDIIANVLKKKKKVLSAVVTMAVAYILISALVIYNVEPESFETFFDAIYWATISLTTVGYGDIYPRTTIGRIVTIISSAFGIAIIDLPSGVITAGYLAEISKDE